MALTGDLKAALQRAAEARVGLDLDSEAWRLFHGIAEGRPGLTVDRYGEVTLVQTFREPLDEGEVDVLRAHYGGLLAWNHRGRPAVEGIPDLEERSFQELGLRYLFQARHPGADPWLFLDFRAARRWLLNNAQGEVLNAFAYTCGAGLAAARAGAQVVNLDHGGWPLEVGERNAALNGLAMEAIQADYFVAVRQFSGLGIRGRAARRGYPRFAERRFDLIVLDPPTFTKGPFGAVDLVRDYASLLKPALLSLKDGGAVLAANHSARLSREDWLEQCRRCATKAGRPLRDVELLEVDADFPSFDGEHPLKLAILRI